MAVTLLDASQAVEETSQPSIVPIIVETVPEFAKLPFETAKTLQYEYTVESALPTPAFRGYGEAYTGSNATFFKDRIDLKLLGCQVDLDRKQKNLPLVDQQTMVSKQLNAQARAISLFFKKTLFKGKVGENPKSFNGIDHYLSQSDFSGQTVSLASGGSTIATAGAQVVLEKMLGLVGVMKDIDAFYTNRTILFHLAALAKTKATNEEFAREFALRFEEVLPGIKRPVGYFMGIPMYALDTDHTGTEILQFTETNNTSGIYAVKWGKDYMVPIQDQEMGPEMFAYDDGTGRHVGSDWAVNIVPEQVKCIGKLDQIKAA